MQFTIPQSNIPTKNLIIRTEERPKKSTLATILNTLYLTNLTENIIDMIPIGNHNGVFSYNVTTYIRVSNFDKIKVEIVSGNSSFIDYLIFEENDSEEEKLVTMIEETKTDDSESRNTGVYQRASKFVYANLIYPSIPKYLLYADENNIDRNLSDTARFGIKLLKTINVGIIGKNKCYNQLSAFQSVDEIINFKNAMNPPPKGNTPILITKGINSYI